MKQIKLILAACLLSAFSLAQVQTAHVQDTVPGKKPIPSIKDPAPNMKDTLQKHNVPKTQQDSAYKRKRITDPLIYPADSTQMK